MRTTSITGPYDEAMRTSETLVYFYETAYVIAQKSVILKCVLAQYGK
jgi:hypothetical protein